MGDCRYLSLTHSEPETSWRGLKVYGKTGTGYVSRNDSIDDLKFAAAGARETVAARFTSTLQFIDPALLKGDKTCDAGYCHLGDCVLHSTSPGTMCSRS